jgi:hypothetical protein
VVLDQKALLIDIVLIFKTLANIIKVFKCPSNGLQIITQRCILIGLTCVQSHFGWKFDEHHGSSRYQLRYSHCWIPILRDLKGQSPKNSHMEIIHLEITSLFYGNNGELCYN